MLTRCLIPIQHGECYSLGCCLYILQWTCHQLPHLRPALTPTAGRQLASLRLIPSFGFSMSPPCEQLRICTGRECCHHWTPPRLLWSGVRMLLSLCWEWALMLALGILAHFPGTSCFFVVYHRNVTFQNSSYWHASQSWLPSSLNTTSPQISSLGKAVC